MGYPMDWRRVISRNGLAGDYSHNVSEAANGSMLAGDLRRLERDSRDELHLALYAKLAGIEPVQAKALLDAFFGERDPELHLTPEEAAVFEQSTLHRAAVAERRAARMRETLWAVAHQIAYLDRDLGLGLDQHTDGQKE